MRREAGQTSLPMYQTIVSFVRQMDLGGRSYAPGEANTLHELLPQLSQFNNIMEKLQTKLEETSGAVAAVPAALSPPARTTDAPSSSASGGVAG